MGGREVSRESFHHALRMGRSCLVVPGGQAEMCVCCYSRLDVSITNRMLHNSVLVTCSFDWLCFRDQFIILIFDNQVT
jgi:hypothetical protein